MRLRMLVKRLRAHLEDFGDCEVHVLDPGEHVLTIESVEDDENGDLTITVKE